MLLPIRIKLYKTGISKLPEYSEKTDAYALLSSSSHYAKLCIILYMLYISFKQPLVASGRKLCPSQCWPSVQVSGLQELFAHIQSILGGQIE